MAPKVTCYPSPGKRKGLRMCQNFAKGCRGWVAPEGHPRLEQGAAFFYGWTDYSAPLIAQCIEHGKMWFYADNAYYFGRGRYFRITINNFMHDGRGHHGDHRLREFGIRPKPWKRGARDIVIATQSEAHFLNRLGLTRDQWTAQIIEELEAVTDRPIKICHKPDPNASGNAYASEAFEPALKDAWAVVSHSSSAMVKALIEGVPVFSLGPSMASCMGKAIAAEIEVPYYPDDRWQWLANLAANQWTFEEMVRGVAWRHLMHYRKDHVNHGQGEKVRTGDRLGRTNEAEDDHRDRSVERGSGNRDGASGADL